MSKINNSIHTSCLDNILTILFSSSNNLTSEIYWTTEETILVTLNNPCINYSLQISAWNNVGKGNITTLPLILYQG